MAGGGHRVCLGVAVGAGAAGVGSAHEEVLDVLAVGRVADNGARRRIALGGRHVARGTRQALLPVDYRRLVAATHSPPSAIPGPPYLLAAPLHSHRRAHRPGAFLLRLGRSADTLGDLSGRGAGGHALSRQSDRSPSTLLTARPVQCPNLPIQASAELQARGSRRTGEAPKAAVQEGSAGGECGRGVRVECWRGVRAGSAGRPVGVVYPEHVGCDGELDVLVHVDGVERLVHLLAESAATYYYSAAHAAYILLPCTYTLLHG